MYALIATDSRLKTTSGGFFLHTERSNATGGVRRAEASTIGRHQIGSWSKQTARTAEKQKCFELTLPRKELATT